MGGWPESDNKTISVQLDLTWTGTGTELGNMGVRRCVRTSGMQTNAFKQLFDKFNGSKFKKTDFQNFPLYFLIFPLYNIRG